MDLLVCAATEMEIGPFREWAVKNGVKIDILITGVGMLAATYALTRAICRERPDAIIQAGVGGALDTGLPLGKVYAIHKESIGDLGVEENGVFRTLGNLGLQAPDEFPWTNGFLENNSSLLLQCGLPIVDGVTVNEISTNPERIRLYKEVSGATAESMEGAALHYVGRAEKISFLQVRALSNFAGERDKAKWVMKQAVAALNETLEGLVSRFLTP
jgi:futalosine hydrolase